MSAQVINNEKYQMVQNVFEDLKKMMDKHGFDLLGDDNLKSFIQHRYEKFNLKMDSKITVGAIFDARSNNSSLIDALVKTHVSERLTMDVPYLVKGDAKSKEIHIHEDVSDIKTISVPTNRWKVFENSVLLLSSKNYLDFMKKLEEKNDPDVVVLVVNTPGDLKMDHIKSFLSKTAKMYNNGNFILVLNEAKEIDCVAVNICDVCYPEDIRTFLKETGIEFEDKSFKISSSKYNKGRGEKSYLDENLEKLKESLEVELNIDTVVERFYKDAQKISSSMTDIKKSFDEKKARESINQMNRKLEDHSIIIKESINIYENNTNQAAEEYLTENSQNYNIEVRDLMKPFFAEKLNQFDDELKAKIAILTENDENKEEHRKFKNILNDIFFNQTLKKEEIEETLKDYLNTDIMKYKVNEMKNEEGKEKSSSDSLWKTFINGTKEVVGKICNKAKDAYDVLVNTFKETTEKLLEAVKNTVDHAINLLRNDFMQTFLANCKILTKLTEDEQKKMLTNLDQSISSIEASIKQKEWVDIYSSNFGVYISKVVTDSSTKFSFTSIMDELYSKMRSFGYNKYTTDLCNEFNEIYRDKYSPSDRNNRFDSSCRGEFRKFQDLINENRFYDYQSEERQNLAEKVNFRTAVIAGATTGAVSGGVLGFGIFSPITAIIGGVTGAAAGFYGATVTKDVLSNFDNTQNQVRRKFIKTSRMLEEVNNLKTNMRTLIDDMIQEIIISIEEYLEFMTNLQNLQN